MLYMPPYLFHLLQPLDIGCFLPLKRAYGHQVETYIQLGRNHIDKLDFIKAFKPAHMAALNASNIRSEFAVTGLIPYNSQRVLSHLYYKLRTFTLFKPETIITIFYIFKTPYIVAEVAQEYTTIKNLLKQRLRNLLSPMEQALKRVVKGCQITIYNAILLISEIKDLKIINERQKRKRNSKRIYIVIEGILTTEKGRIELIELE